MKSFLLILLFVNAANAVVFTHDPAANLWQSNVVAAGSVPKGPMVQAVNRLAINLKRGGEWDNVYAINPVAGGDLTSSLVRLKVPDGVAVSEASHNFSDSDYSITTGRTGNGTSKYVDTGINPRALGFSTNSLGLWVDALSTQAMGTTRIMLGNLDSSGNVADVGVINSGAQETGVIGGGSSVEYPAGTNVSITGFVGVNARSFPFEMGSEASSVASPAAGSSGFQGIATDGTFGYLTYNDKIVKYRISDNTSVLTNASPYVGASSLGTLTHLGDPCIYNGNLVVPAQTYNPSDGIASNACFLTYSTNDLSLLSTFSISNVTADVGGSVVGNGILYAIAGGQTQHTNIFKFDPDTFEFLGVLTMELPMPTIQGIEWTSNGYIVISEGGSDSPANADFYLVDPNSGELDMLNRYSLVSEAEGIAFNGTNIIFACVTASGATIKQYPFSTNSTSARRGQQYFLNGLPFGLPGVGTKGLANNNIFVHAINNNGSAASYSARKLGLYAVTQGLTRQQVNALSATVKQFDFEIGR